MPDVQCQSAVCATFGSCWMGHRRGHGYMETMRSKGVRVQSEMKARGMSEGFRLRSSHAGPAGDPV